LRLLSAFLGAVLFVGCAGGAEEQTPVEESLLPGGYKVRLDEGRSDPGQFSVSDATDMMRFTTGPAGVAWRPRDVVSTRDIRVEGTLQVFGAPVGYREGYGIFVGGRNMESPSQSYAYLMVRPDGDFSIRVRKGDLTETVVEWTPHDAVQRVSLDGEEPMNRLVIQARGGLADFLVNGTRVFRMDVGDLSLEGVAGVRINHRLDVGLTGWSLAPPPPLAADSTSGT